MVLGHDENLKISTFFIPFSKNLASVVIVWNGKELVDYLKLRTCCKTLKITFISSEVMGQNKFMPWY